MAPLRKLQASTQAMETLRDLWGPGDGTALRAEIDRDIARTLMPPDALGPMSAVDELALVAKYPHLPPLLRRFASGSPDYDTEELHQAIQDAIVRGPRQPEIAQEDLDTEIEAALTNASRGVPSPDLHDRVLELMHERDAYGIGWYPEQLPKIDLQLRSESITAKPRRLGVWPPPLPEPSVVDRLAAQVDPAAAERVARVDAARALAQASADELWALFPDEEEVVPLDAGVGWNNDDEEMATAEEAAARPVTPVASRPPPSLGLRARESRG